tara:strand:+ start:610 stop:975 length:366 start_codon:yes stop_codon:yes gene_type:complete
MPMPLQAKQQKQKPKPRGKEGRAEVPPPLPLRRNTTNNTNNPQINNNKNNNNDATSAFSSTVFYSVTYTPLNLPGKPAAMKAMKSMGMNRMLGSIRRKRKPTKTPVLQQQPAHHNTTQHTY